MYPNFASEKIIHTYNVDFSKSIITWKKVIEQKTEMNSKLLQ